MAGEDLYASPIPLNDEQKKNGYQAFAPLGWGGVGYYHDGGDNAVMGTSGQDQAVARYQDMGTTMRQQPAYQLQYGDANGVLNQAQGAYSSASDAARNGFTDLGQAQQSREQQQQALGLQQQAAQGTAPSRAEMLGRSMIDQSLKAQVAGAGSARGGPLAQMAAQRQAQNGAAEFQQQGANQLSALRADEMERARGAYMQGASGMRAGDYQGLQGNLAMANTYGNIGQGMAGIGQQYANQANSQGQMELGQRQLNQQGQMGMEQLGWDTNNASLNANAGTSGREQQDRQHQDEMRLRDEENTTKKVAAVASMVGGGMAMSDMRAKKPEAMPLLIEAGRKPTAAEPAWLAKYMDQQAVRQSADQEQADHSSRMRQIEQPAAMGYGPANGAPLAPQDTAPPHAALSYGAPAEATQGAPAPAPPISRDDPYVSTTPGDIQREDPYGSGETFFSDEDAKTPAGKSDGKAKNLTESVPMMDEPGQQLRQGADGRAFYESEAQDDDRPSLAGPSRVASNRTAAREHSAPAEASSPKAKERQMTPEEMEREANALSASMQGEHEARMAQGPAVRRVASGTPENGFNTELTGGAEKAYQGWHQRTSPWDTGEDYDLRGAFAEGLDRDRRGHLPDTYKKPNHETFSNESQYAPHGNPGRWEGDRFIPPKSSPVDAVQQDANRRGAGFPYTYKDEFTPPEQSPGELNYGPSANELEQNPLTATAIRRDPRSGMRAIDVNKMVKNNTSSIASLQGQIDKLRGGFRNG